MSKLILQGKVRDIYEVDDDKMLIVVTDRMSAYDVILPTPLTNKGVVLNQISKFWFDYCSDIVPNHIISTDIADFPPEFQNEKFAGRSMLVKKLRMLPVECIVRGYITGSGWKDYQKTGQVSGITLPKGLQESAQLPKPIFTPSTKAEIGEHDENVPLDYVINQIGIKLSNKLKETSIAIYKKCSEYALSKGIIIADTKFEFGLDAQGNLVLGDEALTPDSSRFWDASEYEVGKTPKSYDKQFLRDWLTDQGLAGVEPPKPIDPEIATITAQKYQEVLEKLTK
jgi:phosphoribosylaminoimidazole-succinocarboxamide synthase